MDKWLDQYLGPVATEVIWSLPHSERQAVLCNAGAKPCTCAGKHGWVSCAYDKGILESGFYCRFGRRPDEVAERRAVASAGGVHSSNGSGS